MRNRFVANNVQIDCMETTLQLIGPRKNNQKW